MREQKTAQIIKVGMADLKIAVAPDILTTLGLGSCVGISLYDPVTKIAGLVHIMLPDSTQMKNNTNYAKFADTGIENLLEEMVKKGAKQHRVVAKIAGGAQMFNFKNVDENMRIGSRNTLAVKAELRRRNIPILAEDTGSNYGRTVELCAESGNLTIKTIGHGTKIV